VYKNTLLHYIAIGVVGLIVILILLRLLYNLIFRVRGRLVYHEKGFLSDQKESVDLSKLKKTKFSVGRKMDSVLRLKELELKKPFIISRGLNIFVPGFKIKSVPVGEFEFLEPKKNSIVNDGDKFRISNLEFEYKKK